MNDEDDEITENGSAVGEVTTERGHVLTPDILLIFFTSTRLKTSNRETLNG